MPSYPELHVRWTRSGAHGTHAVVDYLVGCWLDDYHETAAGDDSHVVQVTDHGNDYLFDITPGRLLAAWCISGGRHGGKRDASRMRGHPLGASSGYHRGHAIAHTMGGGCDINLVPQRGKLNIGAFRVLEKLAVATPGALYFTYWCYADSDGQLPTRVEQGFLPPGGYPRVSYFDN